MPVLQVLLEIVVLVLAAGVFVASKFPEGREAQCSQVALKR
jgi:hypothetical protein